MSDRATLLRTPLSPEERSALVAYASDDEACADCAVRQGVCPSCATMLRYEATVQALEVPRPTDSENERTDEDYADFGPRFRSIKDVRQLRALDAFLRTGSVAKACAAAGVTYGTWYRWKKEDREFRRTYDRCLEEIAGDLEVVGLERARDSSDPLLMFFLKAAKPEKYRDRQIIEVVSPAVTTRLAQQADAILNICRMELDAEAGATVASKIADALRAIWTSADAATPLLTP